MVSVALAAPERRPLLIIARTAMVVQTEESNRPGVPGGVGAPPGVATADIFGKFTLAALRAMVFAR